LHQDVVDVDDVSAEPLGADGAVGTAQWAEPRYEYHAFGAQQTQLTTSDNASAVCFIVIHMSTDGLILIYTYDSMAEEERTVERAHVEEREGRQILVLRWNTGKTSAGRLFGRYGAGGRPDFFRLLFGAVAGSLREKFGPPGRGDLQQDKGLRRL
jgi:hypothetical protein